VFLQLAGPDAPNGVSALMSSNSRVSVVVVTRISKSVEFEATESISAKMRDPQRSPKRVKVYIGSRSDRSLDAKSRRPKIISRCGSVVSSVSREQTVASILNDEPAKVATGLLSSTKIKICCRRERHTHKLFGRAWRRAIGCNENSPDTLLKYVNRGPGVAAGQLLMHTAQVAVDARIVVRYLE